MKQVEKPKVLKLKDLYVVWRGYNIHLRQVVKEAITENIAQEQRDADLPYIQQAKDKGWEDGYTAGVLNGDRRVKKAIQQAKEEAFEEIEKHNKHHRFGFEDGTLLIYKEDWQSLKHPKG